MRAPTTGKIVKVAVSPGDEVTESSRLIVMEAMKMEHDVRAGRAGIVAAVHVAAGDFVPEGAVLVEFPEEEEEAVQD